MQKICYICKKKLKANMLKVNTYRKVKDHCHYTGEYRGAAQTICNLNCSVPKEIPVVFHNESNHEFCFMINDLTEKFEGQFTCLEENTEKYIIFSVPIEKDVTRTDEKGKDITKTIYYRLKIIDSARRMARSLSNLANNLAKKIHKIKCNTMIKNVKLAELNRKIATAFLNTQTLKII